MILSLDHVVIAVADLEKAIQDYENKGFTVVPGGEHPGGATHNALVSFADGSYLELIAFKQPAPEHRWWKYVETSGYGLLDFALLTSNLPEEVTALNAQGLDYAVPKSGGRLRPDGVKLDWQVSAAPESGLPFLITDVTPRPLRVPDGEAWQHKNGALGVSHLGLYVKDVATSVKKYEVLLENEAVWEGNSASFVLGETALTLSVPPESTAAYAKVAQSGDYPFLLHLRAGEGISISLF